VSKVTEMGGMFHNAKAFSKTLCGAWQKSTARAKSDMLAGSSGKLCTTTTTTTAAKDINECLENNGGCDSKRKCINTVGSMSCGDCPAGYTNDGAKGCKDVNECATNNGGCSLLRKCMNTAGSMSCGNCAPGYLNDGAKGCKGMASYGQGHCKSGYLRGWDGKGTASQEACNAVCLAESDCGYAAFFKGKTCSRYNHNTCELFKQVDHFTYKKTALPNQMCVARAKLSGKKCVCRTGYSGEYCAIRSNRCVTGGDGWVQLGNWRFGCKDYNHWAISPSTDTKRSMRIFRGNDGKLFGNDIREETWSLWTDRLGSLDSNAHNIKFGDGFMQCGAFRFGQHEGGKGPGGRGSVAAHLSLSTSNSKMTIYIWRGDGNVYHENLNIGTWHKSSTNQNNGIGNNFLELGGWRFGQADATHASVGYKGGTVMIWRNDKTWHPKRATTDYSVWSNGDSYGAPIVCGL